MTEEESCPSCRVAVALGMYINICRELGNKKECEELFDKVTREEITPDEVFKQIKEKAKDKPETLDMLKYIDTLMEKADND